MTSDRKRIITMDKNTFMCAKHTYLHYLKYSYVIKSLPVSDF